MNYQFDALAACTELRKKHASYLLDAFRIPPGLLADRLLQNWTSSGDDPERLFAPPIVQGAWPYKPARDAANLEAVGEPLRSSESRPLHPKTVALMQAAGFTRALYEHQVAAVSAAATGNTVILSAGTGSGKTEAFLIPLLDRLFWDEENGLDNLAEPGIRAIIIYPLNALVNNQVDRVIRLLRGQQRLTFAYYTGRLKENYTAARSALIAQGRQPEPSQIIDRVTLRGLSQDAGRPNGPPHILITNFSMLEYMLIRPIDRTIFNDEYLFFKNTPRLKVMVLDEAHVYAGSQAAEIHMLLRRTADRFKTSLSRVQGFATSATLGAENGPALKTLARSMFAKSDDQVTAIVGTPYLPELPLPATNPPLDPTAFEIPAALRTLDLGPDGEPQGLVVDPPMADELRTILQACGLLSPEQCVQLASEGQPAKILAHAVRSTPRLVHFRRWLFDEERQGRLKSLDEIAAWLFGTQSIGEEERICADRILRLCSLARMDASEHPFLAMRMHAILRTPAGMWVDARPNGESTEAWPWGRVSSRLPAEDDEDLLEVLTCSECGEGYLRCWTKTDGEFGESTLFRNTEAPGYRQKWVPLTAPHAEQEWQAQLPERWGARHVQVIPVGGGNKPNSISRCTHCGEESADLKPLTIRPNAVVGPVIDAIYPFLGAHPAAAQQPLPGDGRRVLTFSDSRHGTASLAAEVEYTHDVGLNRQLLWQIIRDNPGISGEDLVAQMYSHPKFRERADFANAPDENTRVELARVSVFREFARLPSPSNITLETLGLVQVVYPNLPSVPPAYEGILSSDEWHCLLATTLDHARRQGAVQSLTINAQELQGLLRHNYYGKRLIFSPGDAPELRGEPSLVPTNLERNPVVNFARRVIGVGDMHDGDAIALLRAVWGALLQVANGPGLPDRKCVRGGQGGIQVYPWALQFTAPATPAFISPDSRALASRSLRNIPTEFTDESPLRPLTTSEVEYWRKRHAVRRVTDDEPLGLWSVEHTAQIDVDALEQDENAFRNGKRNLISSSTTMEMGVDLGGLTFVLMTNVPPAPSNYWQRAGRAGRRADGSSLVLTLAPAKPHDQRVFSDLRAFLRRPIRPPEVRLDAAPLVRRHVHAWLLSCFFEQVVTRAPRGNPMYAFGDITSLLTPVVAGQLQQGAPVDPGESLLEVFEKWCDTPSPDLLAALRKLVDGTVLASHPGDAVLRGAAVSLRESVHTARIDLDCLAGQIANEQALGQGGQRTAYLNALQLQQDRIMREALIRYLARTGFLPRFGFPVDIIRLDTGDEELRMERPLDAALSEYTPGAEVVAKKRIHRIGGLIRNWLANDPGLATRKTYLHCRRCGNIDVSDADRDQCSVCHHPAENAQAFYVRARATAQQLQRDGGEIDLADQPTPLRHFLQPTGFRVVSGESPRRVREKADAARMPPARMTLSGAAFDDLDEVSPDLTVGVSQEATLLIRSEGLVDKNQRAGYGFAICQVCGFSVAEPNWGDEVPPTFQNHRHLIRGTPCQMGARFWRHMTLGTSVLTDAFRLSLTQDSAFPADSAEDLALTFAVVLQQAAAEILQVDSRTLQPLVSTLNTENGTTKECVILDRTCSGVLLGLRNEWRPLLQRAIEYLQSPNHGSLILFETQQIHQRLRPKALLQHLREKNLHAFIAGAPNLGILNDGRLELRNPRPIVLDWLSAPGDIVLLGSCVAEDGFEPQGILRALHSRALLQRGESRLLLGRLPNTDTDEALLLSKLATLARDGVKIRIGQLPSYPWGVVRRAVDGYTALGSVNTENQPWTEPAFGSGWQRSGAFSTIRTDGVNAELMWEAYDNSWSQAAEVAQEVWAPPPTETTKWISVPQGKTTPEHIRLSKVLERHLGPLHALGTVTRLSYRDRFFATNIVSFLRLAEVLKQFRPAPGAAVDINSHLPRAEHYSQADAQQLLNDRTPPSDLSKKEAEALLSWTKQQAGASWDIKMTMLDTSKKQNGKWAQLPHARRLDITFATGGTYASMHLLFDHGLQGVRRTHGTTWMDWSFVTEEEHITLRLVRR